MPPAKRKKKKDDAPVASRGLDARRVNSTAPPAAVQALAERIERDGGTAIGIYRDPLGGNWQILAALPLDRVEPTPYQRDLSEAHVGRLAIAIDKLDRFLDPVIAVPAEDGKYWSPNGYAAARPLLDESVGTPAAAASGSPSTTVLPPLAAASSCTSRSDSSPGWSSSSRPAFARLRNAAVSPRARSRLAAPSCRAVDDGRVRALEVGRHHDVADVDRQQFDPDLAHPGGGDLRDRRADRRSCSQDVRQLTTRDDLAQPELDQQIEQTVGILVGIRGGRWDRRPRSGRRG